MEHRMHNLRIHAFGVPRIYLNERLVALRNDKTLALLLVPRDRGWRSYTGTTDSLVVARS